MINLTKEEILKRIEGFNIQYKQIEANLYACGGAIKALEDLLEEPKEAEPEVK